MKTTTVVAAIALIAEHELTLATGHVLHAVRAIGPNSFFVGSDSGLVGTPKHTDALVMAARVLRQNGIDEQSLDAMFKDNPAPLLGGAVTG